MNATVVANRDSNIKEEAEEVRTIVNHVKPTCSVLP